MKHITVADIIAFFRTGVAENLTRAADETLPTLRRAEAARKAAESLDKIAALENQERSS